MTFDQALNVRQFWNFIIELIDRLEWENNMRTELISFLKKNWEPIIVDLGSLDR